MEAKTILKACLSVLIISILQSCSRTIYLSTTGTVISVHDEFIDVNFVCENYKRPDCYSVARFSKKDFPFAYEGMKVRVQNSFLSIDKE